MMVLSARSVHKASRSSDQGDVVCQATPTYRLVDSPSNGFVALGILQKNHHPDTAQNTSQPVAANLERVTKPACTPVRVGQCFCVCTVEYD
jgi:hypothetical protein